MKKIIIVAGILAGVAVAESQAKPMHTGFLVGANVGAMSVDGSLNRALNQTAFPGSGDSGTTIGKSNALIGLFLGYGWSPKPVGVHLGFELFGQLQNINMKREDNYGPAPGTNVLFTNKLRTTNTLGAAAKLGYLYKEALFYGKLGVTCAKWKFDFSDADTVPPFFAAASSNSNKTGFLVGVGMDYAIACHWALGAEYTYTAYSSIKLDGVSVPAPGNNIGSFTYKPKVNTFNLRLKYTF